MTTSSPAHFARQHDSHLKHLKLKGLQPKTIDACARAIRRLAAISTTASRRSPRSRCCNSCSGSHPPADAGRTPAGVCLPLLRQTDADPAAATSADGGQLSSFGAGNGYRRISPRHHKDGAPTGATAALSPKMSKNGPMTEKPHGSAGFRP